MSEVTLYGYILSQPVRSVLEYLILSNINHTFISLDSSKGDLSTPEFTNLNPFQSVPTLLHNDYSLWESASIITYLSDALNINNQYYPKDLKIRARINAYLHWHHQNIRDPCNNYLDAKIAGPKRYNKPELTEPEENLLKERFNQMLEDIKWSLKATGFIARTDSLTIADIFAYNELTLVNKRLFDLDQHPEIQRWYEGIELIESVKHLTDQANGIYSVILGE